MNDAFTENTILIFFAQGAHFLLMALLALLLLRQYKVRIKLLLGSILAFWVLLHVKDMIIYYGQNNISLNQNNLITMIDQLAVPLSALFQLEIIKHPYVNLKRTCIYFIPYIVFLVMYALQPSHIIIVLMFSCSAVYLLHMLVSTILMCRKMPKDLPLKRTSLVILGSLMLIGLVWMLSCVITMPVTDILYYILSGVAWVVVYFSVDKIDLKWHTADRIKKPQGFSFVENLDHLLNEEQIYLNPELTITDVARMIGTNRSYLSEYFNNNCNSSFIDYINNLRLNHAEKLMMNDTKISLDELSSMSGFNSLSTFRRAFMKKHGVTPSNYRQECMPRE